MMCLIGIGWKEGVRQLRDNEGDAMEVGRELIESGTNDPMGT